MKLKAFFGLNYTTKTMQKITILVFFLILLSLNNLHIDPFKQRGYLLRTLHHSHSPDIKSVPGNTVRVVFWNVENLYDTYDDTTRLDNEFTPSGMMRWNYTRFHTKLNHVAKTLLAIGEWEPPGIIGLCEIENRYVMNRLIYESPLKPFGYRMVHHESPDLRGIDVALLYRPSVFRVLFSKPYKISFPFDTAARTREILLIQGVAGNTDTLDLLINHWPSRRGGYAESQPRRDFVAGVLRKILDSIQSGYPQSKILIMGDFNDEPSSASICGILHALSPDSMRSSLDLINLMFPFCGRQGSHRYRGNWSMLDQFMASGSLIRPLRGIRVLTGSVNIYRGNFLLKEDVKYFGSKPFRTFNGYRYEGGFSDHLPVVLDLEY